MYKLYRDKNENFECKIELKGVPLNESKIRLILESENWNLVFDGTIDPHGKCSIPIKKLRILPENTAGKMFLEVIADDVYFQPWTSQFTVLEDKKAIVEVLSDKHETNSKKPKVTISEVKNDQSTAIGFVKELKKHNITLRSLVEYKVNKSKIERVMGKYIYDNKLSKSDKPKLFKILLEYVFNKNEKN